MPFDFSKYMGGKGAKGGGMFDFSKFMGGKAAGGATPPPFDFSKFMGGKAAGGAKAGGGMAFDFSKFMGGKAAGGAKGGGMFDFSKFMGGKAAGGAKGAGASPGGGMFSSNAAYLTSIGVNPAPPVATPTAASPAKPTVGKHDALNALTTAKKMLDAGLITQADYDEKKKTILSGL